LNQGIETEIDTTEITMIETNMKEITTIEISTTETETQASIDPATETKKLIRREMEEGKVVAETEARIVHPGEIVSTEIIVREKKGPTEETEKMTLGGTRTKEKQETDPDHQDLMEMIEKTERGPEKGSLTT